MHPMLNIAVKAARRAGTIINRSVEQLDLLKVQAKQNHNDLVSDVDRAAEQAIVDILLEAYPQHAILGEEGGARGRSEYTWIVDPLDGTTNFLHGFPQYAVSIALKHRDSITQAVVFDPSRNDLFTASRGSGAYLNNRRIRVSRRTQLADCLLGTGFPFREFQHLDAYLGMVKEAMQKTRGIRRPGAAALDLAYVAAGRLDGFWEFGLKPWDIAAGCLLIQEAGGLVADFTGDENYLENGNLVCATPKVFPQLLQLIQNHLPAAAGPTPLGVPA